MAQPSEDDSKQGRDSDPTQRKIARPDEERGWPRREACPDCGYPSGHADSCPNR